MNRDLDDQEVLFMWRMFRAAILGVLIGIVGGVIFGQVSYVKKYKDKVSREKWRMRSCTTIHWLTVEGS